MLRLHGCYRGYVSKELKTKKGPRSVLGVGMFQTYASLMREDSGKVLVMQKQASGDKDWDGNLFILSDLCGSGNFHSHGYGVMHVMDYGLSRSPGCIRCRWPRSSYHVHCV